MVADNLKSVTRRIARCCEKSRRLPEEVSLVCVTKEASVDQIRQALNAGATTLGENRVRDAGAKYREIGDLAAWHLIGHLQTNKVRDAVKLFSLVHSVDSLYLAQAIDREARKQGKVQKVLIQVNVADEETKFGIPLSGAPDLVASAQALPNLRVEGLMTIAPLGDDPEKARPIFRALRQLRDTIDGQRTGGGALRQLSMGMTDDFEVAIEEGSTMVRVGRAIFHGPA
jgi:PLP dependent protein